MSISIGPTGSVPPARLEPSRTQAPADPELAVRVPRVEEDRLEPGSTPPPEAREQVETAYQRALELATENRELHFGHTREGGIVVVQVRDLDGNVIRSVPTGEAFAVLAGAEL